ncbi:hypothetical protein [Streptomyces sp. NPDC093600]|uniref:hypothetical protein n=1 Tax=Streptomyces sp. NPDC093600 TaxID=3366047 RepID=UPI003827EC7D
MAVIVVIEMPGVTQEQYEENSEKLTGAPWWPAEGFIAHAGGKTDDGWIVVDLWESADAFRAFSEKALPILESSGMTAARPKVYEASRVVTR